MSDAAIRAAADIMQWVDLALAGSILLLSLLALWRWRQARALLIGLITVAAHGVVFHAATMANLVSSPEVNLWSATLRAHIYAFLLATLIVLVAVAMSPPWEGHYRDD